MKIVIALDPPSTHLLNVLPNYVTDTAINILKEHGHTSISVHVDMAFPNTIHEIKPDIVLNLSRGSTGKYSESYVPIVLDSLDIPYSGSDPLTTAICQDKLSCKNVVTTAKIPVIRGFLLESMNSIKENADAFKSLFPLFFKPNNLNRGYGVTELNICKTPSDLILGAEDRLSNGFTSLLVEEFIRGRELSFLILGNGADAHVFPPIEIMYEKADGFEVYGEELRDYYESGSGDVGILNAEANFDSRYLSKLKSMALSVYNQLGCMDYAQIDFMIGDDKVPYLLDVNIIPEFSRNPERPSRFCMAALAEKISLDNLLLYMVHAATSRVVIRNKSNTLESSLGGEDGQG